ncbi:AAA family ATPase [Rhizobium rhizogenes]|uniref:AAA family ATPase n=1 Tax=Rhizobium rhizogenes TaxID=359 RepID=UPI001573F663|nr:AAA family ATPase [Rhizobium rhizogenes]NTF64973.1 AAA family ATPase [Rhizobium rhizogenes]NTG96321.1 AAA family ATPase [Rhizobium rhizogenes]
MSYRLLPKGRKIQHSVKDFAMYCTIRRAVRSASLFNASGHGIIVLVVPEDAQVFEYVPAVTHLLYNGDEQYDREDIGFTCIAAKDKPAKVSEAFESECRDKRRAIVIACSRDCLPSTITLAADHIFDVEPVTARDLRAACAIVLKVRLSTEQAHDLMQYPFEDVLSALRAGRSVSEVLRRLKSSVQAAGQPKERGLERPQTKLEDLHGYGSAKTWGLQLATDLADWRDGKLAWSDVDRGLLLSGPPGVGKTIFARALAESCGVHFIATSVAQWQAQGHLGDLLNAMRSNFAEAVSTGAILPNSAV